MEVNLKLHFSDHELFTTSEGRPAVTVARVEDTQEAHYAAQGICKMFNEAQARSTNLEAAVRSLAKVIEATPDDLGGCRQNLVDTAICVAMGLPGFALPDEEALALEIQECRSRALKQTSKGVLT